MPYYEDEDYDDDRSGYADFCSACGGECDGSHGYGHNNEDDEELIDGVGFAEPGGNSALRAATKSNPRNLPCPHCHAPNRLTPIDQSRGYQCDACADAAERGWDRDYVCGGSENGCVLCKEAEDDAGSGEE